MSNLDLSYFKAIHNATDTKTFAERQAETTRYNTEKNFSKTYGTKQCMVNDSPQELIINEVAGNNFQRTVITRPSQTIRAGDIVDCLGRKWIVLEVDPDQTIYTKALIQQCNIILKWISKKSRKVIERYAWAENVTKYSSGIRDSNVIQRVEFQVKVRVGLDEETALLKRDQRFLLDLDGSEYDTCLASGHPDAYILSNRDVFTRASYFGKDTGKVVELTLSESMFNTETDNAELMIADYWESIHSDSRCLSASILYKGSRTLGSNGNFKRFTAEFKNSDNEIIECQAEWLVAVKQEYADYLVYEEDDNSIKVKIQDDGKMIGEKVVISLSDTNHTVEHKIELEVRGLL